MQGLGRYKVVFVTLLMVEDIVLANLLFVGLSCFFPLVDLGQTKYETMLVLINLSCVLSTMFYREEVDRYTMQFGQIIKNAALRVGLIAVILALSLFLIKTTDISRLFTGVFFVALFAAVVLCHIVTKYVLLYVLRRKEIQTRAVIVGAGSLGRKLYNEVTRNDYLGIKVLGYFDDDPTKNRGNLLGDIEAVKDYVLAHDVDQIYCTLPVTAKAKILDLMNFADNNVVNLFIVPTVRYYSDIPLVFGMIGDMPVLSVRSVPLSYAHNAFLKRTFDLVVSTLFLVTLFVPIYLVVGLAIKLSSPGPVIFRQKRTGEGGQDFECYKFRSMRVNASSDSVQATADDNRKTRVGEFIRRTSIDELPQFINVFKGEMSIVGPRPHMLYHTSEYSKVVGKYMVRHFIKPGITGLAQVSGFRGGTEDVEMMEQRIKRDIWYIENWSIGLDLKIIFRTIYLVIVGDSQAY